ncbi:MAG: hypothetical protein LUE63_08535 [Lachnospiraceae bacterium]|nr:hypothetical protein [Lachnospiraceae bacterium]
MEMVRQYIDASKLMSVISLPKALQNSLLEIIVFPAENMNQEKAETKDKGTRVSDIVDSLTGIIPDNGMTLEDYRAERLSKYETAD